MLVYCNNLLVDNLGLRSIFGLQICGLFPYFYIIQFL